MTLFPLLLPTLSGKRGIFTRSPLPWVSETLSFLCYHVHLPCFIILSIRFSSPLQTRLTLKTSMFSYKIQAILWVYFIRQVNLNCLIFCFHACCSIWQTWVWNTCKKWKMLYVHLLCMTSWVKVSSQHKVWSCKHLHEIMTMKDFFWGFWMY